MWRTSPLGGASGKPDVDFTSPLQGKVGAYPESSARTQAENLPKDEGEIPL